ncbi:MAG TPA: DUF695 domain-containing protein [Flavisolibacter sp.]|jgi:hypothetical protein|nr:DUF695 domain-containing protein [Flavisolibacter sp.]
MKSNNAIYTGFEFEVEGYPALAIINSDLKMLPNKSDYAYSVFIEIIPDSYNAMGHPEDKEYAYLIEVEKKMIDYLESETRTVHIGHTTIYRRREIIFYTKDSAIVEDYLNNFLPGIEREHSFDIEEDREWAYVSAFYDKM